ncbi:MAG: TonB-dependent receptor [Cyclobacteriaceae bacterium]
MKYLNILLTLLFASLSVHGQSVQGTVQDIDNEPLPFVNVLLLHANDSALARGAASDVSGVFFINNVKLGSYILQARMIGYQEVFFAPVVVSEEQEIIKIDGLTLYDDATQLGEVVVTEKRPFVEQHNDRMVVNVANSIVASGGTALEVLEKSPGISVDRQNSSLQFRGKSGVMVQINGKQTYLAMADLVNMLESMPSNNIDQIELITNPSAKYDASGNSGIINIKLVKNNNIGTNGILSLSLGTGRYDREQGSLQLNHRTNKVNFFGNYSFDRRGGFFDLQNSVNITEQEQSYSSLQDTYIRDHRRSHNASAGLDYDLSNRTTIGLVWNGTWSRRRGEGYSTNDFQKQPTGIEYLSAKTDQTEDRTSSNHVVNLHLIHAFEENDSQLSMDFDVVKFTQEWLNELLINTTTQNPTTSNRIDFLALMPIDIDIKTAKIDYNRSISDNWKMEFGYKVSDVFTDNDMTTQLNDEAGNSGISSDLANHFQYNERVNAGYLSFSGKLGDKTEAQIGLRTEHTHSDGNSISLDQRVVKDYINFFPTVFLSHTLSKTHTLGVSYGYRIDRPNYIELNPSLSYVDPYLANGGNPFLNPQFTHTVELKHGYKDKIFTSLGVDFINDQFFKLIEPLDSIRIFRFPFNIGSSKLYNLTVSFPIEVMKGWNIQTNFLGLYSNFEYDFKGIPVSIKQVSVRMNISNSFVFGKGWTGELTGWIRTPEESAQKKTPWRATMNLGLQKTINDSFKLKLSLQDVFRSNLYGGTRDSPNFKAAYSLAFETRVVMLNLTYNFGNQKLKRIRQRKTGSETETKRAN